MYNQPNVDRKRSSVYNYLNKPNTPENPMASEGFSQEAYNRYQQELANDSTNHDDPGRYYLNNH